MIDQILDEVGQYVENEEKSFLIIEVPNVPFFIQVAKVGEDLLLDVPKSVLFSQELEKNLLELMLDRYRKYALRNEDEGRLISWQFRFPVGETNKLCYVAREVLTTVFELPDSINLTIASR